MNCCLALDKRLGGSAGDWNGHVGEESKKSILWNCFCNKRNRLVLNMSESTRRLSRSADSESCLQRNNVKKQPLLFKLLDTTESLYIYIYFFLKFDSWKYFSKDWGWGLSLSESSEYFDLGLCFSPTNTRESDKITKPADRMYLTFLLLFPLRLLLRLPASSSSLSSSSSPSPSSSPSCSSFYCLLATTSGR